MIIGAHFNSRAETGGCRSASGPPRDPVFFRPKLPMLIELGLGRKTAAPSQPRAYWQTAAVAARQHNDPNITKRLPNLNKCGTPQHQCALAFCCCQLVSSCTK